MEFIRCEKSAQLLVMTLSRGKANALNAAMIEELIATINDAANDDGVRGIVLASDRPKFFSSGFDVAEVFGYDRAGMTAFFGRFIDLYESMLRLPKPIVAAVSGHAFAGGAVLALACDARVMAEGEFGFALNEVNLGVVLTPGVIWMAIGAVGVRHARRLILAGKMLTPAQSLEFGLADELLQPESVPERATALARELAEKPPLAFGAIKRLFLEATGHPATGNDRQALGQFIEHWFSNESIERREALIQSMRR
ncbi:MAG: enoyl-CoA hydratase/isomerase family protein [Blastocatellia bacterium]